MGETETTKIDFDGKKEEKDKKQKIFSKVSPRLDQIATSSDSPEKFWGRLFEELVGEEMAESNAETQTQKKIRQLVEYIYEKAELIVGSGKVRPSKPDSVTIGFENNKLVIKEIIEIKSSENAFNHGKEKDQPFHTLETIQNIVNILNDLLEGKQNLEIKAKSSLLSKTDKNMREQELNNIRHRLGQIKTLALNQDGLDLNKIVFSENLTYKVVVPGGVNPKDFNPNQIMETHGLPVAMELKHSAFTKRNIYQIIENHEES